MNHQQMKRRRGFTLIELLVVIAIIGLLATIAVITVSGVQARARDTRRQADLKQLGTAIQLYYEDNGAYPMSNGWCTQISNPTSGFATAFQNAIAPYLANVPHDPSFAGTYQDYFYRHVDATHYYLYAELEGSDRADDGFVGCTRIDGLNNEYDYRYPAF